VNDLDPRLEEVLRPHLVLLEVSAPITPDLVLRDAGVDSLALIELLINIEQVFEIEFPDELLVADTFSTPRALWQAISKLSADS
jgi:acyl carrier protein